MDADKWRYSTLKTYGLFRNDTEAQNALLDWPLFSRLLRYAAEHSGTVLNPDPEEGFNYLKEPGLRILVGQV